MRSEAIDYLNQAGFDFKPAESPDLWTHLESHFLDRQRIGARFNALASDAVADLIRRGEEALLTAMATQHRATGRMAAICHVLELPYIVGCDDTVGMQSARDYESFMLVDRPGSFGERLIRLLPAGAGDIPTTRQATVSGGVYADGHTVGFFDLCPGSHTQDGENDAVHLATPIEIVSLTREMESNSDQIAIATQHECAAMIAKVRTALKM